MWKTKNYNQRFQLCDICSKAFPAASIEASISFKQAIRNFVVGDMVQFTNKTGGRVNATVEKVNKKYVIVSTHIGGEKWRVPATMLKKISEIA